MEVLFGWGLGTLGAATIYQLSSVFLLKYLIDFVGLGGAVAGALIFSTKIYDAVIDPMIGMISDKTHSRWGRRRPYILFGGLIFGVSSMALFSIPAIHNISLLFLYLTALLLVNTTGYALVTIPYLAMPAEMTRDPHQRTRIMSFRVGALGLSQITGPALAPLVIAWAGGGVRGYAVMGVVMGLMVIIFSTACFALTVRAPVLTVAEQPTMSFGARLKTAFQNTPFVVLLLVKLLNLIGVNFFFAALPFFFIAILKQGYGALGVYFLVQAVGIFASQPLWVRLSRRLGKRANYTNAALLYGLFTASFIFAAHTESSLITLLRGLLVGIASGGLLLAGQSMLPDAIAYDFRRTGLRREGVFAGVYTTAEKLSIALAALLIGSILTKAGYIGGKGGNHAQTAKALHALTIMMLIPAAFQILSTLALIFYRLPKEPAVNEG